MSASFGALKLENMQARLKPKGYTVLEEQTTFWGRGSFLKER